MFRQKISQTRWRQAQEFEVREWKISKEVVDLEWKELLKKFTKKFKSIAKSLKLNQNSKILDVGCGPTVPTRLLGTGKITGLEPLAKKLGIEGGKTVPGVKIVNGKGEAMPFADSSFDFVICRNAIDHTNDPEKVIRESYRVLRPRGHLLLICYTYTPFITLLKNLSEKFHFLYNVGHPFTYTPSSLEDLVAGKFEILERHTYHTGLNSADYGKTGIIINDNSLFHKLIFWINSHVFGYNWFLKEYGILCVKVNQ